MPVNREREAPSLGEPMLKTKMLNNIDGVRISIHRPEVEMLGTGFFSDGVGEGCVRDGVFFVGVNQATLRATLHITSHHVSGWDDCWKGLYGRGYSHLDLLFYLPLMADLCHG